MAKRKLSKINNRKEFMNGNKVLKYILIPCALTVILSCAYLMMFYNNKNSTDSNIAYIKSFMTSSGQLRDYANKLGMHETTEDIKWYKTNKEVRIEFGRISLTWDPEEFFKKETLDILEGIGFTIKNAKDKEGNEVLKVYYQGVEIERWVR